MVAGAGLVVVLGVVWLYGEVVWAAAPNVANANTAANVIPTYHFAAIRAHRAIPAKVGIQDDVR
jgi:hypothetical protein